MCFLRISPWDKNCTRAEICRNFKILTFFPVFKENLRREEKEFLEISTNFCSCTVFTPNITVLVTGSEENAGLGVKTTLRKN